MVVDITHGFHIIYNYLPNVHAILFLESSCKCIYCKLGCTLNLLCNLGGLL